MAFTAKFNEHALVDLLAIDEVDDCLADMTLLSKILTILLRQTLTMKVNRSLRSCRT